MEEQFEQMLTGGHPNSLGRTIEVVEIIFKEPARIEELYNCYFSTDEVVRLRVSNAFKRLCKTDLNLLIPFIDRFIDLISKINQPSTKWTLAQLFLMLKKHLSETNLKKVKDILKYNLETENDWIVINFTLEALTDFARTDENLKNWLRPHLIKFQTDKRKSVATRAKKFYAKLFDNA
jgi:hypothetical protein